MEHKFWHVIGYTWSAEAIFLQVRDLKPNSPTQNISMGEGDEFVFRKSSERRCIGWIDFDKLEIMSCPDIASGDFSQCDACRFREGFMKCVVCNGYQCPTLKPSVERYCRQLHHLYLACFGDEQVKVGTASDVRKQTRLYDQGPLCAMYVAMGPGPTIKQIEANVSKMGYTESMTKKRKQELLASNMTFEESYQLVLTALKDITTRIIPKYEGYFHEPELLNMPALSIAARKHKDFDILNPEPDKILGGQVIGASGNTLLLKDNAGLVTLDLSSFKSWIVELNPQGPRTERVKQLSLF